MESRCMSACAGVLWGIRKERMHLHRKDLMASSEIIPRKRVALMVDLFVIEEFMCASSSLADALSLLVRTASVLRGRRIGRSLLLSSLCYGDEVYHSDAVSSSFARLFGGGEIGSLRCTRDAVTGRTLLDLSQSAGVTVYCLFSSTVFLQYLPRSAKCDRVDDNKEIEEDERYCLTRQPLVHGWIFSFS